MTGSQSNSSKRASALADRLLQGAGNLAAFAEGLSEAEWQTPVLPDGRTVGVIVHHVASVYPLEIELARKLAAGKPITGATLDVLAEMNGKHAAEHGSVGKQETLDLLARNSQAAADAVRSFSDGELDSAATVSLNADAPLTAQFFIEDHALRHSFHHLERIKAALNR